MYLHSNFYHNLKAIDGIPKDVGLRIRRIYISEQDYLEKLKKYMVYLVARGYSPKKVKQTFEHLGKMARNEARVKKQRTIIFPDEYNPRHPDVQAIITRHKHVLQNNAILKELFPTNLFIASNKRANNLRDLFESTDPYYIKTIF